MLMEHLCFFYVFMFTLGVVFIMALISIGRCEMLGLFFMS